MRHDLEPTRTDGARIAWAPRVGNVVAATAFLTVLAIAAWTMAGPPPESATRTAAATQLAAVKWGVRIADFAFQPKTLEVPVGATVTWTNADADAHTVTSSTGAFASPGLDGGDTFAQTFTAPGTYDYHCALHPHMTARIIVK